MQTTNKQSKRPPMAAADIDKVCDSLAARYALAIARNHDWGELASLQGGRITGLIDAYVDADGVYHVTLTSVPATVKAVLEYGNY